MQQNQEIGSSATPIPSQGSTENEAREELQAEIKSCQRQIKGCLLQMIVPLFIGILEAVVVILYHYTQQTASPESSVPLIYARAFTLSFITSVPIILFTNIARRAYRLRKKGVAVTGTVIKHSEWDEIEFVTHSEPIKKISIPYDATRIAPNTEIIVVYDPKDPQNNLNIGHVHIHRGIELLAWGAILPFAALNILLIVLFCSA